MAAITIRDVPDATRDELAARAARSGRSLQEYLKMHLIEVAGRPDAESLAKRIAERKTLTGTRLPSETIVGYIQDGRR